MGERGIARQHVRYAALSCRAKITEVPFQLSNLIFGEAHGRAYEELPVAG
jgi:hypothetical protein